MPEGKKARSAAHAVTQADIAEDMRNDDGLCRVVGTSVLDRDCYVHGGLPWSRASEFRRWRDSDDAYLYTYEQERVGARSREDVRGAFRILCAENELNPIDDMLRSLPKWDHDPERDSCCGRSSGRVKTSTRALRQSCGCAARRGAPSSPAASSTTRWF
jgi:hypothetical protein